MEENYLIEEEESSIDFKKIFNDIVKHRMLYAKVLPIAFVLAAIYALAQPNYYNCTVKLSPEMSGSKSTSGLAALASSFGVNLGSGSGVGSEALFPTLYPDLMNSVDFKTSLFHVPVTIEGDKEKGEKDRTMSYYDYLSKEQKSPWWSQGIKAFFSLFSSKEEDEVSKVNKFRLTKEQADIVKVIDKNVVCDVDKKTMVITIDVTDQDPVIAATMADTVKTRLQNFITDYRTSKARVDLEYNRQICAETK
ncbi:MAG: chain-length determining protein, partial [Bacteroidaceae bacterium]|nr:chain-length determining protein [Bacteroidaceae bacterium]